MVSVIWWCYYFVFSIIWKSIFIVLNVLFLSSGKSSDGIERERDCCWISFINTSSASEKQGIFCWNVISFCNSICFYDYLIIDIEVVHLGKKIWGLINIIDLLTIAKVSLFECKVQHEIQWKLYINIQIVSFYCLNTWYGCSHCA